MKKTGKSRKFSENSGAGGGLSDDGNEEEKLWSTDVGFLRVAGPSPAVNTALRSIKLRIFHELGDVRLDAKEQLAALARHANITHAPPPRTDLLGLWTHYVDKINDTFERWFPVLFQIASANSQYVSSDPAHWAAEFLQSFVHATLDHIRCNFLREYQRQLGDQDWTVDLLLTDFYQELSENLDRLESQGLVCHARVWKTVMYEPPKIPESSRTPLMKHPAVNDTCILRFTLSDLEDPPEGVSRREIVFSLHGHLKSAIRQARIWCDQQVRRDAIPTPEEIAGQFPVLEEADSFDFDSIRNRKLSPCDCSIEIMYKRCPDVARDTIVRYASRKRVT